MVDINNSVKDLRDADMVIPNLCSRAQKDLKEEQWLSCLIRWWMDIHLPFQTWSAYQNKFIQPLEPLCNHWLQRLASTKHRHQEQAALPRKDGSHASFSVSPLDHTYSLAMFHRLVCKNSDILQSSRISQQLRTLMASYWEFLKTQQLSSMPHKTHVPESKRPEA